MNWYFKTNKVYQRKGVFTEEIEFDTIKPNKCSREWLDDGKNNFSCGCKFCFFKLGG